MAKWSSWDSTPKSAQTPCYRGWSGDGVKKTSRVVMALKWGCVGFYWGLREGAAVAASSRKSASVFLAESGPQPTGLNLGTSSF